MLCYQEQERQALMSISQGNPP
jgi:hypothetical protein